VVKVFELAVARTGLRDQEAQAAGFDPLTVGSTQDDHKAYYPGAHQLQLRITGDRRSGQLLGAQLGGDHCAEVAKRTILSPLASTLIARLDRDDSRPHRRRHRPQARLAAGVL
jgi:NADPH-dependent 2,4-dienoyl-CoA reductase/sulfur reductase-like enzyme